MIASVLGENVGSGGATTQDFTPPDETGDWARSYDDLPLYSDFDGSEVARTADLVDAALVGATAHMMNTHDSGPPAGPLSHASFNLFGSMPSALEFDAGLGSGLPLVPEAPDPGEAPIVDEPIVDETERPNGTNDLQGEPNQRVPLPPDNADNIVNEVPEPASLSLFTLGIGGLAAARRRRAA